MAQPVPAQDRAVQEIFSLLFRLSGSLSLRGYYYTAEAVLLCIQQPERLLMITKWVYPTVARMYQTDWKAVERNIRTFISAAWKINPALLTELAQRPLQKKPTPKEFIAIISTTVSQSRAG